MDVVNGKGSGRAAFGEADGDSRHQKMPTWRDRGNQDVERGATNPDVKTG